MEKVTLDEALEWVGEYSKPERFADMRRHLDPAWIEQALEATGTATLRKRRLPAEQVVWLVIGMALYRDKPIHHLVDRLDLVLPGNDEPMAPSAIVEARARLGAEPDCGSYRTGRASGRLSVDFACPTMSVNKAPPRTNPLRSGSTPTFPRFARPVRRPSPHQVTPLPGGRQRRESSNAY